MSHRVAISTSFVVWSDSFPEVQVFGIGGRMRLLLLSMKK
ncbi:unnamed protein product [Rhodiola kirilowii]